MAEFKGRLVNVSTAIQNGDTVASAPEYFFPWVDLSFRDVLEQIQNESAFGNIAHYNDIITTGIHGEGDIKTKLWYKGLYYQLYLIFGQAPTKTAGNDGSYKYTFTMLNSNQHAKGTIFVSDPNSPVKYPSAMINEATIEWTPSDFATMTMSMISKKSTPTTAPTAAFVNDHEFRPDNLELKFASTVAGLETAEVATKFTSASMAITKTVEGIQTSDSGQDYGSITNGDLEATMSFEKLYTDTAYRKMATNNTAQAMSFGFVDSVNKAGTTTNTSLKFICPKVMISSYEPSFGLSDTATESIECSALLDLAEGYLMKAELTTSFNIGS